NGDTTALKRWFGAAAMAPVAAAPSLSVRNKWQSSPAKQRLIAVPADTIVQLKLNQGLSSRTAQRGDIFTARVTAHVVMVRSVGGCRGGGGNRSRRWGCGGCPPWRPRRAGVKRQWR